MNNDNNNVTKTDNKITVKYNDDNLGEDEQISRNFRRDSVFSKDSEQDSVIDEIENNSINANHLQKKLSLDNINSKTTFNQDNYTEENTFRKRHKPIISNSKISKKLSTDISNLNSAPNKIIGFNLIGNSKTCNSQMISLKVDDKLNSCKAFTLDSDGKNMTKGSVNKVNNYRL